MSDDGSKRPSFIRRSRYGILGESYQILRVVQFMTLITIIGLTANFVAKIVDDNTSPPALLISILALVCLAALYLIILAILFWDQKVTYTWALAFDSVILAGLLIIAVIAGKPLSYVKCNDIGGSGDASAFASTLASFLNTVSGKVIYTDFIAASKQICNEMKAIWGLVIASCIFFAFTVLTGVILFFFSRRAKKGEPLGP
ncbi:hypothetical protein BGW36DRAFT_400387 [Talaromyces proteolyticus]|uniref:MARVEL domain-containing protein n=1 Tax=Talaromyces proteolyticus TaxID=1131652 RepID=A0AAD4PUN5_9EURO|nr:uncharacterized protein BGW36DRAFT_400387 [Talaromyces proteolyticus]KAH8692365.1 hypothetical protein BGW36DRAFT_400387 [Talaromyces proteolyticus]